jgi:hypothetical protein
MIAYTLEKIKLQKTVLILTKVSSVTDEITTRLTNIGGIKFQRNGNHYFNKNIEVANLDAMIHYHLQEKYNVQLDGIYGESYNWKLDQMHQMVRNGIGDNKLYTKNNEPVDILIIDEFQDFDCKVCELVFDILCVNKQMILFVMGDILQTVFTASDIHPFDNLKIRFHDELDYRISNTCYRCPKPVIEFVNCLHVDDYHTYNVKALLPVRNDIDVRPILFAHYSLSYNYGSYHTASNISKTIEYLLKHDQTLHPRDVAILMSRSHENSLFYQLEYHLNRLYERLGYGNAVRVKIFDTKHELSRISINWEDATDKTTMLSIHGDKGKGHKVVFCLGFTENSIPKRDNLHKPSELLDKSLTHVMLTRSEKYLFVGFMRQQPSRYLLRKLNEIKHKKLAAFAWEKSTCHTRFESGIAKSLGNVSLHEHVIESLRSQDDPVLSMEPSRYLQYPIKQVKNTYTVTDIARDAFETYLDLMPDWSSQVIVKKPRKFGSFATPPAVIAQDNMLRCIYGYMAELMVMREMLIHNTSTRHQFVSNIYNRFKNPETSIYTDDEEILSFATDLRLTTSLYENAKDKMSNKLKRIKEDIPEFTAKIGLLEGDLPGMKKYILPASLNTESFRLALKLFTDEKLNLMDVPSRCLWNMAIGQTIIENAQRYLPIRYPTLCAYLDFFEGDLTQLKKNCILFSQVVDAKWFTQGKQLSLTYYEDDPEKLQLMGRAPRNNIVQLVGIPDAYTFDCIYEFKCPISKTTTKPSWINQSLIYCCLKNCNSFRVVDLAQGTWTTYRVPNLPRKEVLTKILMYMRLDDEQIAKTLEKIESPSNTKSNKRNDGPNCTNSNQVHGMSL